MLEGDIIISFNNVSKIYNIKGNKEEVINNISFNVLEGEIFGIIGNTGAGKSTILRMINGFIKPDKGEIILFNEVLNNKNKNKLVKETSMIFQNYNLLTNLTVLNNILLPTKIRKHSKEESNNKALEILNFVGLKNKKDAYINTLSGGEKQRVAIARSLITNPKILLLDEPTSALDQKISFEILDLLKKINRKYNTTIVIISHDINVIKYISNRVLILNEGKIEDIISLENKTINIKSYKERLLND